MCSGELLTISGLMPIAANTRLDIQGYTLQEPDFPQKVPLEP